MIVMKFGGTSVADRDRLEQVAGLVATRRGRRPLVVVSALGGVTNLLDEAARSAARRDAKSTVHALDEVEERHRQALAALADEAGREAMAATLDAVLGETRMLLHGVHLLGELTPRTLDAIHSAGERLSSPLLAAVLEGQGLEARAVDVREVLVTDERHGAARPLVEPTRARAEAMVRPLVDGGTVPVLGGYLGATADGTTTTLGRGGSDLTASFLGALLGAEEIEIWTDVDGMLTADPRLVPAARLLPEIAFDEAAELAYFGAKVLHPASIHPALERDIPVRVLNTHRPASPGTLITRAAPAGGGPIRSIACKRDLTVVTVTSLRMLMAHGFLARIFAVFDRHETPVDLVSTSEVTVSLTIDETRSLGAIREELAAFSRVNVETGMAIVCLVGRGLVSGRGVAAQVFDALRNLSVRMVSFGASDINLSLVVGDADAPAAVQALHHAFFER